MTSLKIKYRQEIRNHNVSARRFCKIVFVKFLFHTRSESPELPERPLTLTWTHAHSDQREKEIEFMSSLKLVCY